MRKVFLGVLASVIVFSAGATIAFAGGPGDGRHFVDTDSDGICDNANSMCIYADADGDGICDVCGANHESCLSGDGTTFVDADGDGVCDNYVTDQGRGNRRGNGTQDGCGGKFADADGDGVCDNYVSGQGQGSRYGCDSRGGCGNGSRGGHCR